MRTVTKDDLAWHQSLIKTGQEKLLSYHQPTVLLNQHLAKSESSVAVIS